MVMDLKKVFDCFLYYIVLPFVAISFCLCKLTNDSRIFIGSAAIADNFYSLPYGWDAAYEVKPVGNRILNWILYKVANAFVPFVDNHYTAFGIAVKITALVILVICCWYISTKIVFPYAFPFLFIAFACQANFGIMMSEWFAVLFSLVAVSMCMEENKTLTFFAGVLMVCVGLLKSITSLMLIPMICAVWLLNKKLNIPVLIAGCITASVAFLIMCLTVWPYSIGDMLMSRLIAHVGMYDFTTVLQWFWFTQDRGTFPQTMAYYIPVLLVGIIAALFVCIKNGTDYKKMGIFATMWLLPICIVLAQSEFIVYHYLVMLFPAVISVVMLRDIGIKRQTMFIVGSMVTILVLYIAINSCFGSFTTYEYSFWESKEHNADAINLTNQSALLYLDPGDAPFYFHSNSSCHYITPMPVERNSKEWDLTYLPQYKDTFNCIMSYQGEYIISDLNSKRQYFGAGIMENESIMDMLAKNYTKVQDTMSWDVYHKNK
jgi:hypothetical protein